MGQIPEHWVTFQQVIPKPGLFLFKLAEQGDIKISAATSLEGLKTILYTQKSKITWPRIHSKTGQRFSPTSAHVFWFCCCVSGLFFLEAGLTLPDLSLGRHLTDPLNPGHPRSCVSVRLSLSFLPSRPGKPTLCRPRSEITSRKRGKGGWAAFASHSGLYRMHTGLH